MRSLTRTTSRVLSSSRLTSSSSCMAMSVPQVMRTPLTKKPHVVPVRSLSVMTAAARIAQRKFERASGLIPEATKTENDSNTNSNSGSGSESSGWRDFYLRMYDYAPVALFIAAAGGFFTYSELLLAEAKSRSDDELNAMMALASSSRAPAASSSSSSSPVATPRKAKLSSGLDTKQIAWKDELEGALVEAKKRNAPLMVFVHTNWCPSCHDLKNIFNSPSKRLKSLADQIVMVDLMDEAMPTDMAFYPDGSYVPRIFFLSADGVVRHDVVNIDGDKRFKYFYGTEDHLIKSMDTALKPVVATPVSLPAPSPTTATSAMAREKTKTL